MNMSQLLNITTEEQAEPENTITVYLDNKEFVPQKWTQWYDPKKHIHQTWPFRDYTNPCTTELILNHAELGLLSKYIQNIAIYTALEQLAHLTRKKRQKKLSRFVKNLHTTFARINQLKNQPKPLNFLDYPYQANLKINGIPVQIESVEQLYYKDKLPETKIVCITEKNAAL